MTSDQRYAAMERVHELLTATAAGTGTRLQPIHTRGRRNL